MVLLVSLFVLADSFPGWRSRALLKGLVCALFPWTHVTGALVSAALAASAAAPAILGRPRAGADRPWAEAATVAALAVVGAASMIYFWNHRFHADWIAGGYGLYAPERAFGARNAAVGVLQYLVTFALECPVLVALAAAGVRVAARRPPVDAYLAAAACVTAVILLVFATFFSPDPTRRLAVACPLWAAVAAAAWDRLGLRAPWPQALVAASGLVSFSRFVGVDGGWRVSSGGWNLPQYVLWADLVRAGRPWWMVAGPVALLLVVVLVSTARTWALLREGSVRLDRPAAAL
jgi:hypothetical protein